jgi:hypothetical protein
MNTVQKQTQLATNFARVKEQVDVLTGQRGAASKPLSAIRRGELRPLASLELKSSQVSAAPTQADYNALQSDVAKVFAALEQISNLLGNANINKG